MEIKKVFHTSATTKALIDGQVRNVTLAGVVCKEEVIEKPYYQDSFISAFYGKLDTAPVIYQYVLRIGLSIVAPADIPVARPELGNTISQGKALKAKTCLMKLTSDEDVFDKGMVLTILEKKMSRIVSRPDKYITISKPKATVTKIVTNVIV